jgi:hypothetical protein
MGMEKDLEYEHRQLKMARKVSCYVQYCAAASTDTLSIEASIEIGNVGFYITSPCVLPSSCSLLKAFHVLLSHRFCMSSPSLSITHGSVSRYLTIPSPTSSPKN